MRTQLVLLAPLLVTGCPDREIARVPVEQNIVETNNFPSVPRRDIDILFVIDSSGSMEQEQESLKANFPRFISVLESIDGGLPNVHLGVITPDLGTRALDGNAGSVSGCSGSGRKGDLHGIPGGPLFLSDSDDGAGGRTRNFTGTLAERFAELADVGTMGCGIEQHLESVKMALENNPANTGFLRPNALLAVVLIADEDDCSLAQKALFDGNSGDQAYGERVNFRCTREGIVCDRPSGSLDTLGPREDCHPNEASTMLTPLSRYADFLKSLKTDPRDIIVAGIVGDPAPFAIKTGMYGTPVVKESCTYNGTAGPQFAFPAVRMSSFLEQFPIQTRTTICDSDLSDGITQIAAEIARQAGNPCFINEPVDVDPATDGTQFDCTVTEVRRRGPNVPDEELRSFSECEAGGATPCWRIEADAAKCTITPNHLKLVIDRGSEPVPTDTHISVNCVTAGGE